MTAISKEVALDELEIFINKFVKRPVSKNKLEKTYPDVLDAVMDGFLSFDEETRMPKYKLKHPIKNDEGTVSLSEINDFKTRIKPSTLASLAKGLHPTEEVFQLQLNMTAYILNQPIAMIDKFERYDYDVLNQIASVFS
jgi:hypothetical protein